MRRFHLLLIVLFACRGQGDVTPPVVTWEWPATNGSSYTAGEPVAAAATFADGDDGCAGCTWAMELRAGDGVTLLGRVSGAGDRAEVVFPPGLISGDGWLAALAEDEQGNLGAGFRRVWVEAEPAPETAVIVARNGNEVWGEEGPWDVNVMAPWGGSPGVGTGRRGGLAAARMPGGSEVWAAASGGSAWTPAVVALAPRAAGGLEVLHTDGYVELVADGQVGLMMPASAANRLPRAMAGGGDGVWLALLEDQTASATAHIRIFNRSTGAETAALPLPFPVWDIAPAGTADAFRFLSPETGWNRIEAASGQVSELDATFPTDATSATFLPASAGDLIATTTPDGTTRITHRTGGLLTEWTGGCLGSWSHDPGSGAWYALERTAPWHPAQAALGETPPPSTGRIIRWDLATGWSVASTGWGINCIAIAVVALE